MHRIKVWIRGFFGFSRRETNAFIILLPLMFVILFSEPVYRHLTTGYPPEHTKELHRLDSLVATLTFVNTDSNSTYRQSFSKNKTYAAKANTPKIPFYSFDPNTIEEESLKQFGLSQFLASRIVRFREKGGKFRKKEDLKKIYGMDTAWYNKASSWIDIPISSSQFPPRTIEKKITIIETFDINSADSTQLMKVYGIGPALSRRICTFRDRLGGFISMNQVKEVYGLDSNVVASLEKKFFISTTFTPKQLNINTLKAEDVKHPYLKRKEAQAIVAFRTQHGNFKSLDDLINIKVLSIEWIEKLKPYLTIE